MTLNQYQKKRDFKKTAEPKGKITKTSHHLFVIQKHAASHLHYDFRLELQGVLKSWAVPKGPCLDPSVKRLAMHVEDHPVAYGDFEGIIPKGEYGGGTVMLWDKGIWKPLDENPKKAYEKGHLRFELQAQKLQGRWDLIRFKDENHWFLVKFDDDFARSEKTYDITKELSLSVKSGKNMDEIASQCQAIWSSKEGKKILTKGFKNLLPEDLKKTIFPDFIKPELATLVDKVPTGSLWLHEVKLDGYRILAFKKGKTVTLKSRNNKDWTEELKPVAMALTYLPIKNVVLDGEVVILDSQGKSDFQLLQNSIKAGEVDIPFVYYLFDILYIEQFDLRALPLSARKSILRQVLDIDSPILRYNEHILGEGKDIFEQSCKLALEGIVSKRADSTYVSFRRKEWLKVKCLKRQEFVIGGYTEPRGERQYFGSLLLGFYNEEGVFDYSGLVGTGFSDMSLKEIYALCQKYKRSTNPFSTTPPDAKKVNWLKPVLIAEVEFTEWTADGRLRHPSFKGLRMDKKPKQVVKEKALPLKSIKSKIETKKSITLTHPTKILYPEDQLTKEDLLDYYEQVSEFILPFLIDRPLTLLRCPKDYSQCFYQRHYNKTTPKTLKSIEIKDQDRDEPYLYLNDKAGLLSLVQMGVLEIHPWGTTITHLEKPDILVIDLDPAPDVPWKKVVAAAIDVKNNLEEFKLKSFVKTTGGKGLHVVIPIEPQYEWEDVKEFTHVFVQFLEKLKPNDYISKMTKAKREGKIFIDYLRNQRTATAIAAYSTRARIHAPVSVPLAWDELGDKIEDNYFTIKTLATRLKKLKDPWPDFWQLKQSLRLDEFR